MSSTLDLTAFDAALKQHYVDFTVKNLVYKDNAFMGMVEKYEKFGGKNLPLPLIYGNPQGRSAVFSTAVANKSSSKLSQFLLTRFHDYSLANIDNETMEASMGDANAFLEAATVEIDGAIHSAARSLAISLFRNGTGSIGRISSTSTVGSATITLANINDVVNFEVGQVLKLSSGDGSGLRSGTVTLSAIDRNLGTLTASGNWTSGISAAATGDYISVEGDYNAKMPGLDGWLPMPGVLTSSAFYGVDRTVDSVRLGGVSLDKTGVPIEEAAIDLANRIGREGGKPDVMFVNFENFAALEKALGSKVQYFNPKAADAEVFFSGFKIMGPKGPIEVVPDQNMFSDRMYMLQKDTWKLYSLGAAPKILQSDGLKFLRVSSADAVEIRVGYYAALGCVAPGFNGVAKLS